MRNLRAAVVPRPVPTLEMIERWLRSAGGFGYDEHPPAALGQPPLVDFLVRSKLGYCQQFAGTMALIRTMARS